MAQKCCVCGKELSPSAVRFDSSGSFRPFCASCLGKTVSDIHIPKADERSDTNGWTNAKIDELLQKLVQCEAGLTDLRNRDELISHFTRVKETAQAFTKQYFMALMSPSQNTNSGVVCKAHEQHLQAMRRLRDGFTGEATAAWPMPDVTTEAGQKEADRQIIESGLIIERELARVIAEANRRRPTVETSARGEHQPDAVGQSGRPKPPKAIVDFILGLREFRDSITGERTRFTRPNPDLMTEAEMVKESEETMAIVEKETKRLEGLKGDQ